MKSFIRANFLKILLFVIMAIMGFCAAEFEQSKNRRGGGGSSGLFAFPRVGRSDTNLPSSLRGMETGLDVATNYDDYEDLPKDEMKRAGLIAFPRVGRNDVDLQRWAQWLTLEDALDKRAPLRRPITGLWFGPRLGKRRASHSESASPTQSYTNNY